MSTILNYLKQRSTWSGLTAFLAAVGVMLNPEQMEAIATAGVGIVGLVYAFWDKD